MVVSHGPSARRPGDGLCSSAMRSRLAHALKYLRTATKISTPGSTSRTWWAQLATDNRQAETLRGPKSSSCLFDCNSRLMLDISGLSHGTHADVQMRFRNGPRQLRRWDSIWMSPHGNLRQWSTQAGSKQTCVQQSQPATRFTQTWSELAHSAETEHRPMHGKGKEPNRPARAQKTALGLGNCVVIAFSFAHDVCA